MSSSAVLHNRHGKRLNVFSRQPNAIANLKPNQLQLLLDRTITARPKYDETRSAARTVAQFEFLFEDVPTNTLTVPTSRNPQYTAHTTKAHTHSVRNLYAPSLLHTTSQNHRGTVAGRTAWWSALKSPLPADVHIVAMRTNALAVDYDRQQVTAPARDSLSEQRHTLPRDEFALIMHRPATLAREPTTNATALQLDILNMFVTPVRKTAREVSLTGLHQKASMTSMKLIPYDIKNYLINY